MLGGWWVVSAKIKDQQGLMKDRVRELEGSGSKPMLWQPPRKLRKGWGDKQEVIQ